MSGSATVNEIDLGDGFGEEVLEVSGTKLEVHADGSIDYTNGPIHLHVSANDRTAKREPQIGDLMPAGHPNAGWVYAGISKTTYQPFYVAPKDSGVFKWKQALVFAAREDSRLPSNEELNQLWEAKNKGKLKGTFNLTGSNTAGWYWSSRDGGAFKSAQCFNDGTQGNDGENGYSSLRLVR
jgi:hypothetical protein